MFTRYRNLAVPAHAYGKYRRDPLMMLVTAGYDLLQWAEGFASTPDPGNGIDTDFFDAIVTDRAVVAGDTSVVALTFAAHGGVDLPPWSAGAHVDVRLNSGAVRQYSLCGDPADRGRYRIAVRLVPGGRGGSAEMHESLAVGAMLRISRPRNAFPLAVGGFGQRVPTVRFIAGGIGITPILPMLGVLDRLGMPWSIIYCGRDLESLAFRDELSCFGDKVVVHLDDRDGIATPDALLGDLDIGSAVYVCGPPPMIDAVRCALAERPDVEFHYERFSAAPVVDGREFRMRLASTGEEITVRADQTALGALLDVRPNATYSCRQGFCRSCAVRVLDGTIDHRSTALNPAESEQGYFLPCVSRSPDCLTLDL
ncbi:MAG: oxidoreductase [Mycobacteriaceae bacterium]|nr:oxidoreductase [Mycobacteriaceae bacterium]